jgi:hypothetical protein
MYNALEDSLLLHKGPKQAVTNRYQPPVLLFVK